MVPGIGVECVCLSGPMLAKAGTVLDVCLAGGNRLRSRGMFFLVLFILLFSRIIDRGTWILGCARAVLAASCSVG